MVYDAQAVRMAIGCWCQNVQLLTNDKFPLNASDFQAEWHKRLFQACLYIAKHGGSKVAPIDIYNIAQNNLAITKLFDENNTKDFIETIVKLANIDNYSLYYEAIKRASLLNAYESSGFDISSFEINPEKYSIEDIIQYYEGKQISIKKEFYKNNDVDELKAGDGFEEVKEGFKAEPLFGATTFSNYLNTAARGWIPGQLSIYSVGSGVGKSTLGLSNLVSVCCPQIYDMTKNCYVDNPCYQHKAGLYLQFEMAADTEVTPKIVATISGVPCFNILNGRYEEGEEERVDRAIQILHKSNIYIVTMPNYTVDLIESYVKDYVINRNVQYICYDYIVESASVSSDIAKKNGVATRSDQVLSGIASKLKDLAVEYNVAILTFTQVNGNAMTQEILDSGVAAGSRAIQNKADVAGVIMPLRRNEQEIADMVVEKNPKMIKPNRQLSLYKMRFSSEEQGIKIYFYLDLNTGRTQDCFVTNKYNEMYEMSKTKLVYSK